MAKKWTYERVKSFIEGEEGNNCRLITTKEEFEKLLEVNSEACRIKLKILCGICKKEIFESSIDKFRSKNKKQCNKCGRKDAKSFSYLEIKKYIESEESGNGCILITPEKEFLTHKSNGEINIKIRLKIKCRCGEYFYTNFYNFKYNNKKRCNECGIKITKEKESDSYEYVKNFIEVESDSGCKLLSTEYKNNRTKLKIQCKCGNTFETPFDRFKFYDKRQCNECGRILRIQSQSKTHEQFIKEVYDLVGNEYTVLGKYINAYTKIKIKHNFCNHEYKVEPHAFLGGGRCPICNESKGEQNIRYWLQNNNEYFEKEYKFENLKDINHLRFDYAVFEDKDKTKLKCLIEYDGKQHFKWVKGFQTREEFLLQQKHDEMKTIYCIKNNIKLIRIPYWDFENIEKILDNSIKRLQEKEAI